MKNKTSRSRTEQRLAGAKKPVSWRAEQGLDWQEGNFNLYSQGKSTPPPKKKHPNCSDRYYLTKYTFFKNILLTFGQSKWYPHCCLLITFDVKSLIKSHCNSHNEIQQKWQCLFSLRKGCLIFHLFKVLVLLFHLL